MDHQQRILALAADMGADPKEIDAAIRVMQSGRADFIEILATRMSVKAALVKATQQKTAAAAKTTKSKRLKETGIGDAGQLSLKIKESHHG
jgi:hypothetical protein